MIYLLMFFPNNFYKTHLSRFLIRYLLLLQLAVLPYFLWLAIISKNKGFFSMYIKIGFTVCLCLLIACMVIYLLRILYLNNYVKLGRCRKRKCCLRACSRIILIRDIVQTFHVYSKPQILAKVAIFDCRNEAYLALSSIRSMRKLQSFCFAR